MRLAHALRSVTENVTSSLLVAEDLHDEQSNVILVKVPISSW
jgi:hypothetical protein